MSYRFKYQVFYASFERQKYISIFESARCIEFRITVTSNLERELRLNCNCLGREGKQEQEKIDEEYLASLLFYSTDE